MGWTIQVEYRWPLLCLVSLSEVTWDRSVRTEPQTRPDLSATERSRKPRAQDAIFSVIMVTCVRDSGLFLSCARKGRVTGFGPFDRSR